MEQALTATPDVANIPSISSSAMLVQLNVSVWTARKQDKAATAKIAREAGASDKAGIYNKNILAGCCLLYTSPSPRDGLLSRMPSSA